MAAAALTLFVAYLAITFGLQTWLQVRARGDTGFRGKPMPATPIRGSRPSRAPRLRREGA